jgi:peptidoglycan/xylan/chitin deacetylase (PgdA/CDA1 family)
LPSGVVNLQNLGARFYITVEPPIPITIVNVGFDQEIFASYGTTLGAISLPSTVILNLSNSTTRSALATWNTSTSTYNPHRGGTYPISGTYAVPEGVVTPDSITITINVTVVVGIAVEAISDRYVVKDTPSAEVSLPTSVAIHLQDGTTASAGIQWNRTPLNTSTLGTYPLSGTLIMPPGVQNRDNVTASVRVVVVHPVFAPSPDHSAVSSLGTEIAEFDSLAPGISSSQGVLERDPWNKVSGAASINITPNTSTGNFALEYTADLNLSGMQNLQYSFYTPDLSQIDRVGIWLHSASGGYFSRVYQDWKLVEGWNRITVARDDFVSNLSGSGAEPEWRNINKITIFFLTKNGCQPSVNVDRISYNIQARPKVVLTFDDGWYDLIDSSIPDNGFSYMTSKGFKGTIWAKSSSSDRQSGHDTDSHGMAYMNEPELDMLYNAGWDIGNHTANHPDSITTMSAVQLRNEYLENQNWLLDNRWSRGAHFVAYPSGAYNEQLTEILNGIGVLAARTTAYGVEPNPVDNMYKLKCIYLDTLDTVRHEIQSAIRTGSTVIFMIHQVNNTGGDLAMSTSDFKAIVDYLDAQGDSIDVMTMSEWYNAYIGAPNLQINVTRVDALPNMNVAYGTTLGAIALPTQVGIALSDDRSATVGVTWDTSTYNPNVPGPQILTGALALPGGLRNPSALTASLRITVGQQPVRTITRVATLAAINVAYGTTIGAITLPNSITVTLSDSTTTSTGITWNTSTYHPAPAGTYTLTGTLTTSAGITNPSNLTASISITVNPLTITAVATLAAIHVPLGTTDAAAKYLPGQVSVTLSDGTARLVDVVWDMSLFKPDTPDTYPIEGTLALPEGVVNPGNRKASAQFIVDPAAEAPGIGGGGVARL